MAKKVKTESMLFFERQKKIVDTQSDLKHDIFINISEHQKVTDKTEKGTRVLIAKYPDFHKIYLYKYMPPGSDGYPRGGVIVWNSICEQMQSFYLESVAIHPSGGQHKFYKKEENEE